MNCLYSSDVSPPKTDYDRRHMKFDKNGLPDVWFH